MNNIFRFLNTKGLLVMVATILLSIGLTYFLEPGFIFWILTLIAIWSFVLLDYTLAVSVLLVWLSVQNCILPAFYYLGMDVHSTKLLIAVKDIAVWMLAVRGFAKWIKKRGRLGKPEIMLVGYACTVGLYCIIALFRGVPFYVIAVSARYLLTLFAFFAVGYFGFYYNKAFGSVQKNTVIAIGLAAAVFGLIEWSTLPVEFWQNLKLGAYWTDVKGLPKNMVIQGLPGNFFGYFGFGGGASRRLISFFGDPLSVGYSLCLVVTVLLGEITAVKHKHQKVLVVCLVIVAAAMLFTLTRAAILATIIASLILLARLVQKFRGTSNISQKILVPLAAMLFIVIIIVISPLGRTILQKTISVSDASSVGHYLAMQENVKVLGKVLGYGIGSAGPGGYFNVNKLNVGENAYITVYAQIGLVGTAFLVAFLLMAGYRSIASTNPLAWVVGAGLAGYMLTGLVSDQLLTVTSIAPFWVLLGSVAAEGNSLKFPGPELKFELKGRFGA